MLRKWICLLWVICGGIWAVIPAQAQGLTGTIRIQPHWQNAMTAGVEVRISRVGTVTQTGYCLTDGLADWTVEKEELETGNWLPWLVQREYDSEAVCVAGEEGAVFQDLPSGVYLVRQTATDRDQPFFAPFFLTLPEGDCWHVYRAPRLMVQSEIPKTGDRPSPLIGAMGIGLSVAFLMVFVDEHRK